MSDSQAAAPNAIPTNVPLVFISYSHDSKDHKAWVGSLALKLRGAGVEVLLDQFDLEPGDDVPKYMERSVRQADCVLMICTEAYVRKADDGIGGVGYETTVVTGELVKNLGQNKFVAILRQSGENKILPSCVSTRLYVDLSDDATFEENFEGLLRKIHKAPKIKKGPLGTNPFANETFEGEAARERKERRRLEFSDALSNPGTAYERCLEIINQKDQVAWRRLLRAAREKGIKGLLELYTESEQAGFLRRKETGSREQILEKARQGVSCYAEFIACLIASAETGNPDYAGQLSWIDELRSQSEWMTGGLTFWVDLPDLVFFVTQALVGGMLMESGTVESAYRLATTNLSTRYGSESLPLFRQTCLNGWPEALNHDCGMALKFLSSILDDWKWLSAVFGDTRKVQAAISAYYQMLSFLNFLSLAKRGELKEVPDPLKLRVPLNFIVLSKDAAERGYQLLLRQARFLEILLENNQIGQSQLESLWAKWIQENYQWLVSAFKLVHFQVPYVSLPDDIRRNSKYEL
jgi:TIR domain